VEQVVTERVKLSVDEHVHSAVTEGLRRRGLDVLTVERWR